MPAPPAWPTWPTWTIDRRYTSHLQESCVVARDALAERRPWQEVRDILATWAVPSLVEMLMTWPHPSWQPPTGIRGLDGIRQATRKEIAALLARPRPARSLIEDCPWTQSDTDTALVAELRLWVAPFNEEVMDRFLVQIPDDLGESMNTASIYGPKLGGVSSNPIVRVWCAALARRRNDAAYWRRSKTHPEFREAPARPRRLPAWRDD